MIGLYDSGYGGLTILKALLHRLPQYDTLYLGDNARAPYGGHDPETILQYAREAVNFLFSQKVRLILIACNTVSGVALRQLQEEYLRQPNVTDQKILGVIFPLVEKAASVSRTGQLGVVGTRATVASEAYVHEWANLRPEGRVFQQACPLLVPFIEEGWERKPEATMILRKYLRPLKSSHIDTLILGCTHYPLMQTQFERTMGNNVDVLDTGATMADSLIDYLKRHPEIERLLSRTASKSGEGSRRMCTTGSPERFKVLGSHFFGRPLPHVEKVKLTVP